MLFLLVQCLMCEMVHCHKKGFFFFFICGRFFLTWSTNHTQLKWINLNYLTHFHFRVIQNNIMDSIDHFQCSHLIQTIQTWYDFCARTSTTKFSKPLLNYSICRSRVRIIFMFLRRINAFLCYSREQRNVVYYNTEEHNVKIELRMRLLRYSGAQSSSSSYSSGTVLTKPCTLELRMRLLQYATTTQDRENQYSRKYSRNVK